MTVDDLLSRFPYDPAKRGRESDLVLPRKLECIEDERLRELAATAWLGSKAGREWVERELYRRQAAEEAEKRYP